MVNKIKVVGFLGIGWVLVGYFFWCKINFVGLGIGIVELVIVDGVVLVDVIVVIGVVSLENVEVNVFDLLEDIWIEGGDLDCIMLNGINKVCFL